MAFVAEFACGFEIGMVPVDPTRYINTMTSASPSTKHTGNYGLRFYNGAFTIIRDTPSASLDLSVWVIPGSTNSGQISLYMSDTGTVSLRYSSTNLTWDAYVGANLVAAGSVITTATAWQHVQLRASIGASGTFETKIDGIPDLNYSGNLIPTSSDQISRVRLIAPFATYVSWDDVVFGTGGWPGDLRIDPLVVEADVGTPEWEPSTASDNYECVDNAPPSADYVYTDTDARDLYELEDWDDTDGEGAVIKDPVAVTVWVQTRKEDGNRDDQVRFLQSDGAAEVQSAYTSLLTSYQNLHFLRTEKPLGGVWTKEDVDGLLVGIEADME